jgi:hypothetical protein
VNGNLTPAEETLRALAPWRRADIIINLIDLAAFLETHPDVPVPDFGVLTIPALGDGPDERACNVLATAVALEVCARPGADGCLCASRTFGTLTIEARTPPRKAQAA